jgi:hypothetical protein
MRIVDELNGTSRRAAHGCSATDSPAVTLALGDRLDLMLAEIEHHMQRGIRQLQDDVGEPRP